MLQILSLQHLGVVCGRSWLVRQRSTEPLAMMTMTTMMPLA